MGVIDWNLLPVPLECTIFGGLRFMGTGQNWLYMYAAKNGFCQKQFKPGMNQLKPAETGKHLLSSCKAFQGTCHILKSRVYNLKTIHHTYIILSIQYDNTQKRGGNILKTNIYFYNG